MRPTWTRAMIGAAALASVSAAQAATVEVAPGGLQAALDAADAGDVLALAPGTHPGPVVIRKAVTLEGKPGSVIDGGGQGKVVTVDAPGVTLRGLDVRNSGSSLVDMEAGIFVNQGADGALVEGNRLRGNLIGIYVWGGKDALVRGNDVTGRTDLRVAERGNGIQLWNAPGTRIVGNTVRHGRDGLFTTTSKRNLFKDNRFEGVRFAVHYMYTNESEVSGNVSVGSEVGYAIMFSNDLVIRDNASVGDRLHGLMLNHVNRAQVTGNAIRGRFQEAQAVSADSGDPDMPREADMGAVRTGTGKCLFVYNANRNRIGGNWFEGCEIGIHFTAGSDRNAISGNGFVGNRTQVKYVGTRTHDWSAEGRGNYWSDNAAFDLDGDGIADNAYRPNDMVDEVVWTLPLAKLLLNSPAVQVIKWAQANFPALHPGGVMDSAPLMEPPEVPAGRM